jgi:hypothetical protein
VIHVDLWSRAARDAALRGEWVAFISPDTVFSDSALRQLSDQFTAGKTIVYGFSLRVTEHALVADIDRLGDRSAETWVISARALIGMALENLSPMIACYLRDTRRFGDHPELLLYPVPGEGLVFRAFLHHSLALDATRVEWTNTLSPLRIDSPSDIGFLTDSDLFACVSITPITHQVDWFQERRRSSLVEAALLWNRLNNLAGPYLSRQSFLFHHKDMTPGKWRPVIARADNNVMLTFLAMKFVWAAGVLRAAGLELAADVVAWALLEKKLHKCCTSRGRITILAPTDEALKRAGNPTLIQLLAAPRKELALVLRNHCLCGDLADAKNGDSLATMAGKDLKVSVSGDDVRVGGHSAREIAIDEVNGGNIRIYAYDAVIGASPCSVR